jgi:triacylglycerol lipase
MTQQSTTIPLLCGALLAAFVISAIGCGKTKPTPSPTPPNRPAEIAPTAQLEPSLRALHARQDLANEVRWDAALVLAEISTIAYATDSEQIRRLHELGATEIKPLASNSSEGLVASDAHAVVIAFRGTERAVPADIITDIKIFGRRTPEGRIHSGFFDSVSNLYEIAIDEAIRQGARDKTVWVTGHSLGGAMAMVFGHRSTVQHDLRPNAIFTFGQPLAADNRICQQMLDEFKGDYVRFVNQWDPVTRLLPNYRHAGARVHLNSDGYSLREPMITYTGEGDGERPAVVFVEDDSRLQPMSEAEFEKLERELEKEDTRSAENQDAYKGMGIPILSDHGMDEYIAKLRTLGVRNLRRVTEDSP